MLAAVPDGRVGIFPDELDLAGVLERWEHAVTGPDRVHVVVSDPADPGAAWHAVGELAGFDAERLPLPNPAGVLAPADAAALRLIAESAGVHVDHDELVDAGRGVGQARGRPGYDVVGDLRDLVPGRTGAPADRAVAADDDRVDILTGALAEAVTEVGRLRERVRELERRDPSGQCGCQASSSAVRE